MPLWIIYHPPTTFTTPQSKAALSKDITTIYTNAKLPAFYVNVIFIPVSPENYYIGGVPRPSPHSSSNPSGQDTSVPWIRITIQNIARRLPDAAARKRFLGMVDAALKPHIEDKGYDWEYNVEETDRDLWKVQGLVPPSQGSEAEALWVKENKPIPYE
ncbi:hypothetical protein K469DRAFT_707854 [Zopfia rhizophila CBS 207.26]|uniref:Tautomerase cis-CaaD-like domain-containing protein n=1 Tax=Zopfia rhizophila CBS 207.26 TaxID=1314779 RepID=A0A6A6E3P4_9PEZI|nr:hypothetical protein K469DRAFT_707854 [Zopfia rhizophila CBS 207.26]